LERSGTACTWLGKFIEARAHFENYLSLWNPSYRAFWASPEDLWVAGLFDLSRTLLCLGYIDQALLRQNQGLVEARRLSPFSLVHALGFVMIGDWAVGRVRSPEAMLRSADELVATADELGFAYWLGAGNVHRGWRLGAMGQAAEGIPSLLEGIAICRSTGANLTMPTVCRGRGQLLSGARRSAPAECQILGASYCHQPRSPLARSRQAHRGTQSCLADLRLVHRRFRHAGSQRGQIAARSAWVILDPHLCRNVRCGSNPVTLRMNKCFPVALESGPPICPFMSIRC
jgi:hypothetical protein